MSTSEDNNIALIDLQKMQLNTVKKILNKKTKKKTKSWYKHLSNNSFKISFNRCLH